MDEHQSLHDYLVVVGTRLNVRRQAPFKKQVFYESCIGSTEPGLEFDAEAKTQSEFWLHPPSASSSGLKSDAAVGTALRVPTRVQSAGAETLVQMRCKPEPMVPPVPPVTAQAPDRTGGRLGK